MKTLMNNSLFAFFLTVAALFSAPLAQAELSMTARKGGNLWLQPVIENVLFVSIDSLTLT